MMGGIWCECMAGHKTVAYGKGCYCGAVNIDISRLDEMKEFCGVRITSAD